ncbi:MAG: acetate--CoA ligase family protein [Alphaproteobacteria bacterium]|nr:acetate--CoA ligase family protein [Alphaproteobacteria bacterium]
MTAERRRNLQRLLTPRHIALIGGSDAVTVAGECARIGYEGPIWPVNPKRDEIAGHACFASIEDLPEAPDAVFLAIPREPAIEALRQLNARGAGGVVCYTAGFGEMGGEGAVLEADLIKATGEMALVGPNCYGLINYLDKVALWPFAHGGFAPGYGAAIITQSGMLASDLTMSQRSVPFAYMISAGNQATLALEDFVEALCENDKVRAFGLHIEGLKDVSAFASAAQKALKAGKPIVALKTGSSQVGAKLTESHTGSLSGTDELYSALFERLGIIRVYSPAQLLETLKFLTVGGVPKGTRIAGLTCSGGGATMLADRAEKVGLEFPQPSEAADENLRSLLPSTATVSNPLDYTTPIWGDRERVPPVFKTHLSDGYDAAVIVQDYPVVGLDESKPFYLNDAASFIETVRAAEIPGAVCSTLPENLDGETREWLVAQGVAPMQGIHECLEAIDGAAWYGVRKAKILDKAHFIPEVRELSAVTRPLDEAEGKMILAEAGIPIPSGQVCASAEAETVAGKVGYPVVLKMLSPSLLHKTEAGAVALNIKDVDGLQQALLTMRKKVGQFNKNLVIDRFLVEQMQPRPVAELLVSVRRDPQFGLAMTLASGGVLVELLGNAETILIPADEDDILGAVSRLKTMTLLSGHRGQRGASLRELVSCLQKLADYMSDSAQSLVELEINPLFVGADGICAVDALALKGQSS